MFSVHDEDHLGAASFLGEGYQIHESSLGEFLDADIAQPDVESLGLLIVHAGEAPVSLRTVKADLRIDIDEFSA